MANFVEINVFGYSKDAVTIYRKYFDKPYPLYINLDTVEHLSPIYDDNLNISNEDGTTSRIKTKYFVVTSLKYRYFLPDSEFKKFIKEAETL